MDIKYQTINLDEVIKFYADAFVPKKGTVISDYNYYVDPMKKKVIFELYVENI